MGSVWWVAKAALGAESDAGMTVSGTGMTAWGYAFQKHAMNCTRSARRTVPPDVTARTPVLKIAPLSMKVATMRHVVLPV